MESSAGEWFDSDESEFQMRTALRNSTVLSPRARLVLETLMVLMSLAAVTGNFLVIVIVAATKTFHTVTSVLIINLAISDFLVGIGVMPFVAVSIMNNGWVIYNDLCLYVGYTSSVYCTASVLTLAAIALDRYFSIVDCLRYGSRCTIWRTGSVVIWIWLQAMLTSCPPLLGWSNISFVAPMYSCAVNWAKSPSYTVIMASLSFLLPAIVIMFCYVKIVRVARYHARRIHSLEEHLQRNRATSVLNLQHSFMELRDLQVEFPNSLREQLNNVLPLATCSRPVCHECGGRGSRAVDHLQVPSKQRERNRLPYSAATKKKQATFFYGQITTHMLSVGDSVQEFLLRRLSGELRENPSVPGQVQRAVGMATLALLCDVADRGVLKSQSEAMRSLYSLTDYFYPSSSSSSQHLNQTLLKPTTATVSHPEDGLLLKDWGRIVAQFIGDQWTCLSFLQKSAGTVRAPEAPEVLRAAVDALALLPGHLVLPVLDFMASVLPQQMVQCEESLWVEAVCASWKVVQALSTNPHDFWSTLQGFVRLAFDHGLLQLTEEQNPSITACIQQILSELMELAQVRSGVFNVLIQHCCETWLPAEGVQSDAVFSTALLHLNILTEACVYGPVFRRDQRLVQEVQSYVEQFGDTCAANTAVSSDNRDDQFPRVCALAFLCRLNPSNRLHQRLMEELVQRLLRKDAEISKSKVRYYSNSIQHRVKNRVWQTLLLLLHKLRLEFVSDCVLSHVCEAGFCSNQASVKYLIEWTLILILHLNPSRIQNLWNCFSLEVQWRRAVEVSLQWCFSHNFCVRLYALLALKRVWELEDARALEENLGGLTTVVQACLQQAEAMQNTG
ncbi:unnamed protein product [Leuciscus chuanchicus]